MYGEEEEEDEEEDKSQEEEESDDYEDDEYDDEDPQASNEGELFSILKDNIKGKFDPGYVTVIWKGRLKAGLRCNPRNRHTIDLQTISIRRKVNQHKGLGTEFFKALCMAANRLEKDGVGRGVYLENFISKSSMAWAKKMLAQGLIVEVRYLPYTYVTVPDVCAKLAATS